MKEGSIFVSDIVISKKDGTKSFIGIEPSNIMLMEIKTDDKKRRKTLEKKAQK